MKRLVELALSGRVDAEAAALIVGNLGRRQLKELLSGMRRALRKRGVHASHPGKTAGLDGAMRELYPGRDIHLACDESLGGGARVRAGDDIVDASVKGYIRGIIEKIGRP